MGKKRIPGTVEERAGVLWAKVELPPTKTEEGKRKRNRKRIQLPAGMSRAMAKEKAAVISQGIADGSIVIDEPAPKPAPPADDITKPAAKGSLREWSERWLADRKRRGLSSVKDDTSRLRTHIWPVLGHLPMATATTADLESLVMKLDDRIHAGTLGWKTARNIWGVVSKMFTDAMRSKDKALRVRKDNPTKEVAPPDAGVEKAKTYLYPSEFLALVTCERVPPRWRRLFALSVYTFTRAGELEALRREDIDREHGTMHIHTSVDRYRDVGKRKSTKTGTARRVSIEPRLVPLLDVLFEEGGSSGPLVVMPPAEDISERLRKYLGWAGVTREDLFVTDATRRRITFHDLRATGITWCAIRGDEPLHIQQRAGHERFETTQIYIREAAAHARGFGEPFPVLPASVLGSTAVGPAGDEGEDESQNVERLSVPSGIRKQGGDQYTPKVEARGTQNERASASNLLIARGVGPTGERLGKVIALPVRRADWSNLTPPPPAMHDVASLIRTGIERVVRRARR